VTLALGLIAFTAGVLFGWAACRAWWDETIEAADRE
jgi:hypothetical protein